MTKARMETVARCALGIALSLWLAGDAYWLLSLGAPEAFPSTCDVLWLAGYLAAWTGLALIAGAAPGRGAAALAYSLGDVVLLTLAAATAALVGRRAGRAIVLVAFGLSVCAIADAARLIERVEARAPLALLVLASAAALPAARTRRVGPEPGAHVLLPAAFTLAALGVLLWDRDVAPLPGAAFELAVAVPFLLVLRLALSLRENQRLLDRSRAEALTDSLTGLGNRRALMQALSGALDDARSGGAWRLALFDLDGFKSYNDAFGHIAGDVLIEHLGGRLAVSVRGVGRAFRMGGDEFCVLVPARHATAALVRAAEALREEGEGCRINASIGVVELPGDALDAEAALQLADRRHVRAEGGPARVARPPERRRSAADDRASASPTCSRTRRRSRPWRGRSPPRSASIPRPATRSRARPSCTTWARSPCPTRSSPSPARSTTPRRRSCAPTR